jgi:hypothetical protein
MLCDGAHDPPCGYHMLCAGLDHVPETDWLCKACVDSGAWVIKAVLQKRRRNGKVEYLCDWVGWTGDPTWQLVADIPAGTKPLVDAFNRQLREGAAAP